MAKARTLTLNTKVNVTGADKLRGLGRTLQQTGGLLTAGLTLPILGIGASMLSAAEDAAKAQAKLKNTFDSMGASAFTSVDALNAHAQALQDATTFDDESINEAQAVLLTFGNVTGDAFTRATEAALDLTALFDGDLQAAAIQIGKALNDPIKGITALTRVGVSFTQQQKDQIKVLQQSGDLLGAQTIILAELERQFGGTAEALAGTAGGKMKQALNELNDVAEEFGAILAPVLLDVAKGLREFARWLRQLNPETKEWVIRIGAVLAALGPMLVVVGSLIRAFAGLKVAVGLAGAAFNSILGPIGVAVAAHLALREAMEEVTGPSIFQGWDRQWHDAAQSAEVAAIEITDAGRQAIEESGKQWGTYQQQISGAMDASTGIVTAGVDAMAAEAGELPGKMADELLAAQFDLTDATAQLVEFMDQALSPAQQKWNARAFLASQAYKDGLASGTPSVVLKAEELAAEAQAVLDNPDFYGAGQSAGYAFGQGLTDQATIDFVAGSAARLAAAARGIFPDSEPKDPNSPFRGITKGFGFGEILARGLLSGQGAVQSAFQTLAGGGLSMPALSPAGGGAGSGVVQNFYLQWDGEPPKGRSESEIVGNLQRLLPLARGY